MRLARARGSGRNRRGHCDEGGATAFRTGPVGTAGKMRPAPAGGNTRRKGRYCSTSAKTLMAHPPAFCLRRRKPRGRLLSGDRQRGAHAGQPGPTAATAGKTALPRLASPRLASQASVVRADDSCVTARAQRGLTAVYSRLTALTALTTSRASPSGAIRSCPRSRSARLHAPDRNPSRRRTACCRPGTTARR
ncbi:hypothetical protein bAD24_I06230 [Burkholderia sp. AD24]|nr:hypothetical protein bAD24_I06230 [Burkholderia sp. AD24]